MQSFQCCIDSVLEGGVLSTQHLKHGCGERFRCVVNVVYWCGLDLTAEYVVSSSEHTAHNIRVVVIHVNLNVPCWYFAAVIVDDIEGDVSDSPIMFVA